MIKVNPEALELLMNKLLVRLEKDDITDCRVIPSSGLSIKDYVNYTFNKTVFEDSLPQLLEQIILSTPELKTVDEFVDSIYEYFMTILLTGDIVDSWESDKRINKEKCGCYIRKSDGCFIFTVALVNKENKETIYNVTMYISVKPNKKEQSLYNTFLNNKLRVDINTGKDYFVSNLYELKDLRKNVFEFYKDAVSNN